MKKREYFMEKKPARAIALLPIGVFLVLYLGLGCLFEYGLKIKMGFYNIPIVVAFLAAILVACLQNRALPFDDKLEVMAKGVGDKNIMTMILIFLAAGVFVGVVGRSSAGPSRISCLRISRRGSPLRCCSSSHASSRRPWARPAARSR